MTRTEKAEERTQERLTGLLRAWNRAMTDVFGRPCYPQGPDSPYPTTRADLMPIRSDAEVARGERQERRLRKLEERINRLHHVAP